MGTTGRFKTIHRIWVYSVFLARVSSPLPGCFEIQYCPSTSLTHLCKHLFKSCTRLLQAAQAAFGPSQASLPADRMRFTRQRLAWRTFMETPRQVFRRSTRLQFTQGCNVAFVVADMFVCLEIGRGDRVGRPADVAPPQMYRSPCRPYETGPHRSSSPSALAAVRPC